MAITAPVMMMFHSEAIYLLAKRWRNQSSSYFYSLSFPAKLNTNADTFFVKN